MSLPEPLRTLIESGPLAHLSTIDPDGKPQVSIIWIGLDGEDVVSGHMNASRKVRNVQADPRVVLSFDAPPTPGAMLAQHAVLRCSAAVEDGGAWELLDRLGKIYVEPSFEFPGRAEGGFILRYTIQRIGGVGPWTS